MGLSDSVKLRFGVVQMPTVGRLPIALLTDTLDDEYVVAVVRGALMGAKHAGLPLLCVTGGRIADPDPERAARNFAFEVVRPENSSGVVAVSSVIGSAVGAGPLTEWLARFAGMPTFCVGVPIEGYPSIEVDNARGIRELTQHLLRAHDCRRFVFVRGPVTSAEAEIRFRSFRETLADEGIAVEDKLVCEGDFTKASGALAARTLLAERHVSPKDIDAVIAANDYMALGFMDELFRRQVDVPREIRVAGFDDVDSARLCRPALTTTRQPTELLGRRGIDAVIELGEGKLATRAEFLPTELVLRNSCGCVSAEGGLAAGVAVAQGGGLGMSFVQRRHVILAEVARAAAGRLGVLGSGWEARLLDALMLELRDGGRSSFYRAFEQLLTKLERARVDGGILQDVLTALRRQSLPCVAGVPAARDALEDALHEARMRTSAFAEYAAERRNRLLREGQRASESALRSALFSGAQKLSEAAAERGPEVGVDACVLASFATLGDPSSHATLLFGFGPGKRVSSRQPIEAPRLPLHPVFEHAGPLRVLMPIVTRGQASGAAVVSVTTGADHRLEELRDFFGSLLETSRAVA